MSLWSKKKDTQIETPSMETLTVDEIQVIKATWKNPNEDPLLSGETILYELFHNYPENQKKFDDFKEKSLLELKGSEYILSYFIVTCYHF